MDIDRRKDDRRKLDYNAELLSDYDNSENNREERDDIQKKESPMKCSPKKLIQ